MFFIDKVALRLLINLFILLGKAAKNAVASIKYRSMLYKYCFSLASIILKPLLNINIFYSQFFVKFSVDFDLQ